MIEVREYVAADGKSPFTKWVKKLNAQAAARVTISIERMRDGNLSNVKAVGSGVSELKIDFGPGYRVYFGMEGQTVIILLTGGSKKGQQDDIAAAKDCWADYKKRKHLTKEMRPWR